MERSGLTMQLCNQTMQTVSVDPAQTAPLGAV